MHLRSFFFSKTVAIYALLVCKIFGQKIQSFKFFDKSQVWNRNIKRRQEGNGMITKNNKVGFVGPRDLQKEPKRALLRVDPLKKGLLRANPNFWVPKKSAQMRRCRIRIISGWLWNLFNWCPSVWRPTLATTLQLGRLLPPKIPRPQKINFLPFLLFILSYLWSFVEQFQPVVHPYHNWICSRIKRSKVPKKSHCFLFSSFS